MGGRVGFDLSCSARYAASSARMRRGRSKRPVGITEKRETEDRDAVLDQRLSGLNNNVENFGTTITKIL